MDIQHFDELMAAVLDDYVSGLPRHISDPHTSSFAIMTDDDFENLKQKDALKLFASKQIITTGRVVRGFGWNEESLSKLAHMDAVVNVQGNIQSFVIFWVPF